MEAMNIQVNNILVAITFTKYSKPVFYYASYLCDKLGASLIVLNVINQRDIDAAAVYTRLIGSQPVNVEQYKEQLIQYRKNRANEVLEEIGLSHIKRETIIKIGDPAEEILGYIRENNIDLGILGKSGSEKEQQFPSKAGSVADKVFRHSTIPILYVGEE